MFFAWISAYSVRKVPTYQILSFHSFGVGFSTLDLMSLLLFQMITLSVILLTCCILHKL